MAPAPDEVTPFPRPPDTFTDQDGRAITVEVYDGGPDPLVGMYERFGDADRSQGLPPAGASRVREWLETLLADGLNVVATHDDPIGHAVLVPHDDTSELAIFVRPDYQSSGVGTGLIRTLLGHGQREGLDHVWLTVSQRNKPAVALYEKVGFEIRSRGRTEYEMERPL